MADIAITVDGGTSKRLLTAGKYCDRDISVTAIRKGALVSDVNFYDYDGTLLYAYTIAEANLLTELPQPPTHDGLTFQEWNYPLDMVRTTTNKLNIGATYITSDGKTRLYISVPANSEPGLPPPRNQVPLYFQQTVENGVTIDWGDNSATETLPGTGVVNTTHTYGTAGNFVISLDVADGCSLSLGSGSISESVMGASKSVGQVYCTMLQHVEIGRGVSSIGAYAFYSCNALSSIVIPSGVNAIEQFAFYYCYSLPSCTIPRSTSAIGRSAFYYCYSLSSITVPSGIISIGKDAFHYCYSLSSIIIPEGVTSIGDSVFYYCYSLQYATIPSSATVVNNYTFRYCDSLSSIMLQYGLTGIGYYAFGSCVSLSSITIPGSVTEISDYAFFSCTGVKEYHFKSAEPPTLSSSTVFSSIPSDCIMYVPAGSLEKYKTATNWAKYASYMQEEPA